MEAKLAADLQAKFAEYEAHMDAIEIRSKGALVDADFERIAALLRTAIARLEVLHPYKSPAIVGWPCEAGAATREWLAGLNEGK